jgi:hypothetical protein
MVEEYYRVAPKIAERLVDSTAMESTWLVVIACVEAIERGDYQRAISLYRETIAALQDRLGLQVA